MSEQMSDNELWEKAARALTGQPVKVRFRKPVISAYHGQAYRSAGGAVVDISPEITDDRTKLKVYLHELAHVKLGHADNSTCDPNQPPGSTKYDSQLVKKLRAYLAPVVKVEREADQLMMTWLTYAENHWRRYWRTGDSILTAQLRALAGYVDPALLERLHKTALKATHDWIQAQAWRREQERLHDEGR